jgi:hypothetical protein
MLKRPKIMTLAMLITILAAIPMANGAQEKLYPEIAGAYDMDLGGRVIPFKVLLQEGKLFFDAGVPGQDPQSMTIVTDKELTFKSIDPNGDEVLFTFLKDAQQKITGCTISVPSRNAEATAVKIEKK